MQHSSNPRLQRSLPQGPDAAFDLVVIGGGITGAGIARHASQCGIRTLLMDANDFSSGTSSRSTKLIHGGLRYLAMGDVALVRESALERKSVYRMAPHLAEPSWMLLPARSRLALWKFRAGLKTYEKLGRVLEDDLHRTWGRDDIRRYEPALNTERYPWVCAYREYLTDDSRLVLAALRSAVRDGADVCNYVRATALHPSDDGCRVEYRDELTGATGSVSGRVVVNATGPWVESLLPSTAGKPRLQLSKGVHVAVPVEKLPVNNLVMLSADDGRTLFAIPRGRYVYLGTTDTRHAGGAEVWPEVTEQDVEYVLKPLDTFFPKHPIKPHDVESAWAGLRPLINQPGKAPKEMSRRDEIWQQGSLITIAGGKLTGFRKMAEDVMAAVAHLLRRKVAMPDPLAPLPGGDIDDVELLVRKVDQRFDVDELGARRLVRLYGSEAFDVLGRAPTRLTRSVFTEEVEWAIRVEGAQRLEDVVYRRLRAAWFVPDEVPLLLEGCAGIMAQALGWDDRRRKAELEACGARLAADLSFKRDAA